MKVYDFHRKHQTPKFAFFFLNVSENSYPIQQDKRVLSDHEQSPLGQVRVNALEVFCNGSVTGKEAT